MDLYDICTRCEDVGKATEIARKLGWKGIGVVGLRKKLESAASCIEVRSENPNEVSKQVRKIRNSAELVAVAGTNLEVTRAGLETPGVDMITRPWENRQDSGLNHVLAKLAKKNGVAICFEFSEVLHAGRKSRADVMLRFYGAAKLVRKFKCPFVIASGAQTPWDLRPPSELLAFGKTLGFQEPDIYKGFSGQRLMENRKRMAGKLVRKGVEIE